MNTENSLRARLDWLEGTAMPHARRQENANGFQKGWHAALSRISEGDDASDLAALVPEPRAEVDDTLPWPTTEEAQSNPARVDRPEEGKADGSATPLSSSSAIDRLTAELAEARAERDSARRLLAASMDAYRMKEMRERAESAESQLAALREALKDVEPVSTFTPILWFSLNDHPRYEEYIRVRTLLSDVAALASSRLPSRQEEGRKDDDLTRRGSSPTSTVNPPQPRTGEKVTNG
jgi:hypothetical protein